MNSNHLSIHVNHFIWIHIKPYHSNHINSNQSHTTFSKKWVLIFAASPGTFASQRSRGCHRSTIRRYPGDGRHSSLKVLLLTPIWGPSKRGRETYRIQFLRKKWKKQARNFGGTCLFRVGRKVRRIVSQERIFKVFVLHIRLCQNFATKNIILHQYFILSLHCLSHLKEMFVASLRHSWSLELFCWQSSQPGSFNIQEVMQNSPAVQQVQETNHRHPKKNCRKSVVRDRLILFEGLIFFGSHLFMVQTEPWLITYLTFFQPKKEPSIILPQKKPPAEWETAGNVARAWLWISRGLGFGWFWSHRIERNVLTWHQAPAMAEGSDDLTLAHLIGHGFLRQKTRPRKKMMVRIDG